MKTTNEIQKQLEKKSDDYLKAKAEEIVKIIKDNIVGTTYTDLRVVGSYSRNFQYRNMYSYVVTISYRKSDPS